MLLPVLLGIVMTLGGCQSGGDNRADFSGLACSELADQVESASTGEYMEFRNLRQMEIVRDYRTGYEPPQGEARVLVLRCKVTEDGQTRARGL